MESLNKVILIGNLTRDPEMRVTPKGTSVCQFGLAINRRFNDEGGHPKEDVTFVEIEAWNKSAELVGKYLVRGSQCMVEGRLRYDQWEDKETHQKRSRLKVVLDNIQFLGAPKGQARDEEGTNAEELDGELAGAGDKIPF